MTPLNNIQVFDNVFPEEVYQIIKKSIREHNWGLQSSNEESLDKKLLVMDLDDNQIYTEKLFDLIKKHIGEEYDLYRVYFNAQLFGMTGHPHCDDSASNAYTFLIYVNREWDFLWGGKTIFFDRYMDDKSKQVVVNSSEFKSYFPMFNRALFFPSNIYHYAESPTLECSELRVTLAYKLYKKS